MLPEMSTVQEMMKIPEQFQNQWFN